MKIKIVGINHFPELTGMAPYTAGIAEGPAAYGHDVSLVGGLPRSRNGGSTMRIGLGGHTGRSSTE